MTFSQAGAQATANIDTFNAVTGNQTQYFSTTIIYVGSAGLQEVLVEGLQKAAGDGTHIPSGVVSQLESISRSQGQEIAAEGDHSALGKENSLTQQPEQPVSLQSGLFARDHALLASPVQVWGLFCRHHNSLFNIGHLDADTREYSYR